MRMGLLGVVALGLLTAACGSNTTERAATGALTGGIIGAICCGPIGAGAGVGAGAVGGWLIPEGADTLALNVISGGKKVAAGAIGGAPTPGVSGTSAGPSAAAPSPQVVREAQARLQRDGLYTGYIDGIAGPKTQEAVRIYQRQHGLPQTAQLDQQTLQSLNVPQTAQGRGGTPASGTSAPQQQQPEQQQRPQQQRSDQGGQNPTSPATPNVGGSTSTDTSTNTGGGSNR